MATIDCPTCGGSGTRGLAMTACPTCGGDGQVPFQLGKDSGASKYGNQRAHSADGYEFDSLAELEHYGKLRLLETAGEIILLEVHPRYPLDTVDRHGMPRQVTYYEADFTYRDKEGIRHVVDVKGHRTEMYLLKRKWMLLQYGVEIEEVEA